MAEFVAEGKSVPAGAEEIVRCWECGSFRESVSAGSFCDWWHRKVPRHGYCHCGHRKKGAVQ